MKRVLSGVAALVLVTLAACTTTADGPGGYGPYGRMGPGHGRMMGPGMMGGGYGPGMMGGMGPGMMGNEGWGMGPGMMDGGMMGGGMGPGMMGGGYGIGNLRDLTDDQRTRIRQIQQETQQKQWEVMRQMHQSMWSGPGPGAAFDEQAARQRFDAMSALRKQMFENSLDARKRIDAILTPQQREQLRRGVAPAR